MLKRCAYFLKTYGAVHPLSCVCTYIHKDTRQTQIKRYRMPTSYHVTKENADNKALNILKETNAILLKNKSTIEL